jgi:hypothetical protein
MSDETPYEDGAAASSVMAHFIAPMSVHFSVKHDSDEAEDAWNADYEDALKGYSPVVLKEATKRIMRRRNYTNFPMIAECVQACNEVIEDHSKAVPSRSYSPQYPDWSEQRVAEANRMLDSAVGRKAASEGWIIGLWDFCRQKGRPPQHHEVPKIIASSREAWAAMKQIDQDNPMAPILNKTAAMLRDRRKDLTAIAEGRATTIKEAAEARKQ